MLALPTSQQAKLRISLPRSHRKRAGHFKAIMTTFSITLFALAIPVALAISRARRSGFVGFIGFAVFLLEMLSREAYSLAGGLRKFSEGRHMARRQWNAEEAR